MAALIGLNGKFGMSASLLYLLLDKLYQLQCAIYAVWAELFMQRNKRSILRNTMQEL